mgnify:FL=1
MSQFLEKLYGPTWETDLASHLSRAPNPSLPLPLPPASSSPGLRSGPRPSLLGSGSPSRTPDLTQSPPSESPTADPSALSPEAMREHLESVQVLLRGMERRLIAREVALDQVEKRAKEGGEEAKRRALDVKDIAARAGVVV